MAEFNPDKYLEDFNPDEYLEEDKPQEPKKGYEQKLFEERYGEEATKEILKEQPEPEIGKLEAAALHMGPALVGGIAGVAGQTVGEIQEGRLPKLKDLKDTYYEAKKATQERQDKALSEQPGASVAGMLTGGAALTAVGGAATKIPKLGKFLSPLLPTIESTKKAQRIADTANKLKDVERHYQTYKKLKAAGTAAKIASATKEGAKFGGLSAVAGGDARLLEGDVTGTAKEYLKGVAWGAGFGGMFSSGFESLKGLKGAFLRIKNIFEPYMLGRKGMDLSVNERANLSKKLTKALHADLVEKFEQLGTKRSEAIKLADDVGSKIKTADDVANVIMIIDDLSLAETSGDAKAFTSILKKHLGTTEEMTKARLQAEKQLTKIYQKNQGMDEVAARKLANKEFDAAIKRGEPAEKVVSGKVKMEDVYPESKFKEIEKRVQIAQPKKGKVAVRTAEISKDAPIVSEGVDPQTGRQFISIKDPATGKASIIDAGKPVPQLDTEGATIDAVNELRKSLNGFTMKNAGDQVPYEVRKQATDLRKRLSDMIDKELVNVSGTEYSQINKQFANLYSTLEQAGIKEKPMQYGQLYQDQLRSLSKLFESQGDEKLTYKYIASFMDNLKKGAPDIYNKHKQAIDDLRLLSRYASDPAVRDLSTIKLETTIFGTIGQQITNLANKIGREVKRVENLKSGVKNTIKSGIKKVVGSSPEQVQQLIEKATQKGEKYKQFLIPLERIKTSSPRTKNAILFSLMQNPGFRELIDDEKEE